ncbi:MAG: efflux RND transporter periplasmic adaptor subunit [Steroidobacteraceae bacterium]|nr:efflux RND transporter periplasmic adaptor subunit [Steroidobacteraceae bacterium]
MSLLEEDLRHFSTLRSIGTPRVARNLGIMLIVGVLLSLAFLFFVPWVQNAPGQGRVTSLDPRDRVQTVTALVPGRIAEWYVTEGSVVKQGDPIARIIDNDPLLLERLREERAQVELEVSALRSAMRVSERDVNRLKSLVSEGLSAPKDMELALIKVDDFRSKLAASRSKLAGIDIRLNRQGAQVVTAPRDGLIQVIVAGDSATLVKEGDPIATFAPSNTQLAVELYLDGRDIPLVHPGRTVRLEFEGWPAVQFSGWPAVSRGIFDGVVQTVDAAASRNGLYRILVVQAPGKPPWPSEPLVRLGAKVQGWVMMNTVSVGYELWRQLNDFPLDFQRPIDRDRGTPTGEMQAGNGA